MSTEVFDLIDEQGNPLGVSKERQLVHQDGDWHRTAHVWILLNDEELLLQHRGPNQQSNPNLWDISCAGHVLKGESPEQAAIRELREELGWKAQLSDLKKLAELKSERRTPDFWDREWSVVYLIKAQSAKPEIVIQASELQGYRWLPWRELKALVSESPPDLVEHDEEYALLFSHLE
jgi:isopentenyl-diphosphate delta-isomerase type 1